MSRASRGAALLLVLWMLLLMAGLIAVFALGTRTEALQGSALRQNAAARLAGTGAAVVEPLAVAAEAAVATPAAGSSAPAVAPPTTVRHEPAPLAAAMAPARAARSPGFWARLFGQTPAGGQDIRVEVRRGDTTLTVHWPVQASQDCAAWLRSLV